MLTTELDHHGNIREYLSTKDSDALALRIANRARVTLPRAQDKYEARNRKNAGFAETFLQEIVNIDDVLLLDILDAALAENYYPVIVNVYSVTNASAVPNKPSDLDGLLRDGGSAYCVNDAGNGLEWRVDETTTELNRHVMARSGQAGRHLKAAWQAAYGIRPEPTLAYAEAVKSIEAALIPLVLPDEPKATLGRVLQTWKKTAPQWELAILDEHGESAEISALVGLVGLIWKGHRDRHAGTPTAMKVSVEAAEMAVHAASMIVYWVNRHGLRPK
ncbi:MAG TPA: hypothetical protein VFU43_11020 [Streptosporangiaceae bacterium]|nr:hypothetical protein [Streptosporangiaceae bacterium]